MTNTNTIALDFKFSELELEEDVGIELAIHDEMILIDLGTLTKKQEEQYLEFIMAHYKNSIAIRRQVLAEQKDKEVEDLVRSTSTRSSHVKERRDHVKKGLSEARLERLNKKEQRAKEKEERNNNPENIAMRKFLKDAYKASRVLGPYMIRGGLTKWAIEPASGKQYRISDRVAQLELKIGRRLKETESVGLRDRDIRNTKPENLYVINDFNEKKANSLKTGS